MYALWTEVAVSNFKVNRLRVVYACELTPRCEPRCIWPVGPSRVVLSLVGLFCVVDALKTDSPLSKLYGRRCVANILWTESALFI